MNKTLDILLINPPFSYNKGHIWSELRDIDPPINLAVLCSFVSQNGFTSDILDCNVKAPDINKFLSQIKIYFLKYKNIRFFGLTAITLTIKSALLYAAVLKENYPHIPVIIGGAHASYMPDEVLSSPAVDIVVRGEGENSLLEILTNVRYQEIKGISFKEGKELIHNQSHSEYIDINSLSLPAHELIAVKNYKPILGSYARTPVGFIVASRGCPGECTFCQWAVGRKYRYRNASLITAEINQLQALYGVKHILFYDDSFTANRNNTIEFCTALLNTKTDITWTCLTRIDLVDDDLLKLMKKAGCTQILYGAESCDIRVLKDINKKITPEDVEKAIHITKKNGIQTRLSFMVGNPEDTAESLQKTIKWAKKINADIISACIAVPFPGTKQFEFYKNNMLIKTYDWDKYDAVSVVMKHKNLTDQQISKYYKAFYYSYYFRASYILSWFLKVKRFNDFKILFQGFLGISRFVLKNLF